MVGITKIMETNKYKEEDRYIKAKKKVEDIKGFYWHLFFYLAVNGFITVSKVISDIAEGVPVLNAIWDMPLLFTWGPWGIGLLIHGVVVFDAFTFLLGKNWEERKIKQFIDQDEQEKGLIKNQKLWK